MYCIFEYDIFESEDEIGTRSSNWVFEVPCSTNQIIDIDDGKISCVKDLMENKITFVKVLFIRPFDDFFYVTSELNTEYDSFKFHGRKKINGLNFYVYSRILGKKDDENAE